jgi:ElaB/YqjD/DUF883 family membrane-anchored ribosome-binding protein
MPTASGGKSSTGTSKDSDLHDDFESLKADFADLKTDLQGLIQSALAEGKSSAERAKDQIEGQFDDTRDSLEKKVIENPFASVGVAALIGLLVGFLFSRK